MDLFTKYRRVDNKRLSTIYIEQEPVPGRRRRRYRILPRQDDMQVLVDALSRESAKAIFEREFHVEAGMVKEV